MDHLVIKYGPPSLWNKVYHTTSGCMASIRTIPNLEVLPLLYLGLYSKEKSIHTMYNIYYIWEKKIDRPSNIFLSVRYGNKNSINYSEL